MNIIIYIGIACLVIAVFLDLLTLIWGYQSAKGGRYKSGLFLAPAILYLIFVYTSEVQFIVSHTTILAISLVLLHLVIYFLIPAIFDKILEKK